MSTRQQHREIWLDFLRVTACFLVMVVHATEPFYLGGEGSQVLTSADGLLGPTWTTPVQILATALCSFVIVSLAAVLLRRIPKVGKWIMG